MHRIRRCVPLVLALVLAARPSLVGAAGNEEQDPPARHLICTRSADGGWRAAGFAVELERAERVVAALRRAGIEARVLQFLPLPAEIQELPIVPGQRVLGLAVNLKGEVYGLPVSGRLIRVPLSATMIERGVAVIDREVE